MVNKLAAETSPYLKQHEDNPVDWFPWGPEAFDTARERDVPIFLSVGYSSCHWCHVVGRTLKNRLFGASLQVRCTISVHVGSASFAV
jgi:uncharacterized protein YyaL (SSP411 family)